MAKKDTYLTLVVDCSGSMAGMSPEVSSGVTNLVRQQVTGKGKLYVRLVEFDSHVKILDEIESDGSYEYFHQCGGMTALYDAIGSGIQATKERIESMPKRSRPGLVVFVIVTDGLENNSRQFSRDRIAAAIDAKQKEGWQFTYLGANQDAWSVGKSMGIMREGTHTFDTNKMVGTISAVGSKLTRMRQQAYEGKTVDNSFTAAESKAMYEGK